MAMTFAAEPSARHKRAAKRGGARARSVSLYLIDGRTWTRAEVEHRTGRSGDALTRQIGGIRRSGQPLTWSALGVT